MHARSTIPSRPDAATEFSLSQSLRRALRAVGDRSAVIDPDGALSWNALGERCQRLAGALQQLGMQRSDVRADQGRRAAPATVQRAPHRLHFHGPHAGQTASRSPSANFNSS